MHLNINTKAVNGLTSKLNNMHRAAFPNAVRNTLNDAAFKAKELAPKKAGQQFTVRQKNLFSRFTVIDKAKGYDVGAMVSKVGLDGSKQSKLVDGLEKQETGGNIEGRKLVPHNKGRVSGSYAKKLQAKNQFGKMGELATRKKRVKGAKYILIKKSGSKGTVFNIKGKKLTPVFSYRNTKITRLKPRPFLTPGAKLAGKKIEEFYKKNAEIQFRKFMNR